MKLRKKRKTLEGKKYQKSTASQVGKPIIQTPSIPGNRDPKEYEPILEKTYEGKGETS